MNRLAFLAITALGLAPVPVLADGTMGGKTIDCYCTDKAGARVELGEVKCLEVGGRVFTAQCQMSQNVPMWRELNNGCLNSDAGPMMSPMPDAPLLPARG